MQNVHEVVDRDGKALKSPDLFHPIEARAITKKYFAVLLNILPSHLSEVFAGRRPVGPKLARRLERALEISAGFWLRMQSDYDLKLAEQEPDPVLDKIEDIFNHPATQQYLIGQGPGRLRSRPCIGWLGRQERQTNPEERQKDPVRATGTDKLER